MSGIKKLISLSIVKITPQIQMLDKDISVVEKALTGQKDFGWSRNVYQALDSNGCTSFKHKILLHFKHELQQSERIEWFIALYSDNINLHLKCQFPAG